MEDQLITFPNLYSIPEHSQHTSVMAGGTMWKITVLSPVTWEKVPTGICLVSFTWTLIQRNRLAEEC